MDEIKDIINKVVGDIAQKNPDTYDRVDRIWQNLLSKHELKHTRLVGIKNDTVHVHVDSPAWLYQLRTQQTKILKRLKEEIPGVKTIYFKIGSLK